MIRRRLAAILIRAGHRLHPAEAAVQEYRAVCEAMRKKQRGVKLSADADIASQGVDMAMDRVYRPTAFTRAKARAGK